MARPKGYPQPGERGLYAKMRKCPGCGGSGEVQAASPICGVPQRHSAHTIHQEGFRTGGRLGAIIGLNTATQHAEPVRCAGYAGMIQCPTCSGDKMVPK